MIRRFLLLAGFVIFFFSCKEKASSAPETVLPRAQFVQVLADVYTVEASLLVRAMPSDSSKNYAAAYYQLVFKKNNVSEEQFRESLDYYMKDPKTMDEIYKEVITELSKKEAEVQR